MNSTILLKRNIGRVFAAASILIVPISAQAQTVAYDNLSQGGSILPYTVGRGISAAASFTSSTVDTILASVTVELNGSASAGTTTISLYSDYPLLGPSVDLATLAVLPNSIIDGRQLFTPTLLTDPTLTPGGRYWIVISTTGFTQWSTIATDAGVGVAGEYHVSASFPNSSSTNPRAFVMRVTQVPEVSATGWMTAVAAIGFATVRRWIRRG